MQICRILSADRVLIPRQGELISKTAVLTRLAFLLAEGSGLDPEHVQRRLFEREELQSTGIGQGVAIPHTSLEALTSQYAALILSQEGIPFESVDGVPARIIVGVIGPKSDTAGHLRLLARISRLLRDDGTRSLLIEAGSRDEAFRLIEQAELRLP